MDGAIVYDAIDYPKSPLDYDRANDTYNFTCGLFPVKYSIIYCINRENEIYDINFTYNGIHHTKAELIEKIMENLSEYLKL